MTEVEIEYCVACGLLGSAQEVQEALLSEFGRRLDAVALVPGGGGVFEIRADGETIFDGPQGTYEQTQLVAALRERLPEEASA